MKRLFPLLAVIALSLAACASLQTPLPLTDQLPQPPLSSSVFAGHAQAARFVADNWQALPEHDYDFIVIERRFAGHWEAVKEIHRATRATTAEPVLGTRRSISRSAPRRQPTAALTWLWREAWGPARGIWGRREGWSSS